ncbi:MAG TPA: PAS domain-containing protein, partial [Longimicrobiales bacterium]
MADNATALPPGSILQIADVLDTGCLIVDDQLIIHGWNHWLESASGKATAEVLGRPLTEVLPLGDDSIAIKSLRRALTGESVVLAHQFHQFMLPLPPD